MKEKSLFSLRSFQCAVGIPLSLSIIFSVIISTNSELELALNYQAFNKLLVIFKIPLGILATSFPLVALITANHRSKLTLKQIEEAQQHNKFNNYFLHLEEFEKYMESEEYVVELFIDLRCLHVELYGAYTNFELNIKQSIKKDINDTLGRIIEQLNGKSEHAKVFEVHDDIILNLTLLSITLESNDFLYKLSPKEVELKSKVYKVFERNSDMLWGIESIIDIIISIQAFEGRNLLMPNFDKLRWLEFKNKEALTEEVNYNCTFSAKKLGVSYNKYGNQGEGGCS